MHPTLIYYNVLLYLNFLFLSGANFATLNLSLCIQDDPNKGQYVYVIF